MSSLGYLPQKNRFNMSKINDMAHNNNNNKKSVKRLSPGNCRFNIKNDKKNSDCKLLLL